MEELRGLAKVRAIDTAVIEVARRYLARHPSRHGHYHVTTDEYRDLIFLLTRNLGREPTKRELQIALRDLRYYVEEHWRGDGPFRENPLSDNAMVALGIGGVLALGGLAFYFINKNKAAGTTTTTPPGTPSAAPPTIPFNANDFVPNTATPPNYSAGSSVTLARTTGNYLIGTLLVGTSGQTNIQLTAGDPTYPVGTVISGVPSNYYY